MNEVRQAWRLCRLLAAAFLFAAVMLVVTWVLFSGTSDPVLAQGTEEPAGVFAQDNGGTIYLEPQHSYVNPGGTATVYVWLADVGNIYGLDFQLSFEQAKVNIPSNKATLLWEVFDVDYHITTRNIVTDVDATFDKLWYSVSNLSPAEPFTGTGRLCVITFQGLVTGTTQLEFIYVKGVRRDGINLLTAHVDGSITVGNPTAVAISRFVARPVGRSVRILWSTEQETGLLGFNLYRAADSAAEPIRMNDSPIPAKALGSPSGAQYQFVDRSVEPGVLYHYWLESVQVDGTTTRLGPESASAALYSLDPPIQ